MNRVWQSSSSASSSNRCSAAGSRSMQTSVPPGPSRSAASRACPPPPKVQSTAVSPGRGSRSAISSEARTGTCSVGMYVSVAIRGPAPRTSARAPRRGAAVGELLRDLGGGRVDLGVVVGPAAGVPDLEVVRDADHHARALRELGVLDQMLGDPDTASRVEGLVVGAAVEPSLHHPPVAAERVELGEDPLLEAREAARGIDLDAGVQ